MNQELQALVTQTPLSIPSLVLALSLGFVLAFIVKLHFVRFSSSLSNKESFSQIFPFITLTTILMITVVKTSLALSLGLVGALSIVRFRTPIKDPEELAYLFFSIAIGLGLGANQVLPVLIASAIILVCTAIVKWSKRAEKHRTMFLSLNMDKAPEGFKLEELNQSLTPFVDSLNLRRFDFQGDSFSSVYFVETTNSEKLSQINSQLKSKYPNIELTFIDQNQMPSL